LKTFFSKPYRWAIVFAILLSFFSLYVVLDTFIISKVIQATSCPVSSESDAGTTNKVNETITDTSYKDDNISIKITTERVYGTDLYIADIKVSSTSYLKSAFAEDTFGKNIIEKTSEIAATHDAIFAINGDYCGFKNSGFVVRNGVLYRDTANDENGGEGLAINSDGSFEIVDESTSDASELLKSGALQIYSFGPTLVNNKNTVVDQYSEIKKAMTSNPRTAIGIIAPLHYIFVVSDGRTSKSEGLSLYQLADVMKKQGCSIAYNFDGGGSATMWFNGKTINIPTDGHYSGEREVSDIVYIGY